LENIKYENWNMGGLVMSWIPFMGCVGFIRFIEYELWDVCYVCYVCYVMGYHDITYKPVYINQCYAIAGMNLFELREWVVWTLYVVAYAPRHAPVRFLIYKPVYINECSACMDIHGGGMAGEWRGNGGGY
jgi:hypothetical protein